MPLIYATLFAADYALPLRYDAAMRRYYAMLRDYAYYDAAIMPLAIAMIMHAMRL